jgi:hypothetical protein
VWRHALWCIFEDFSKDINSNPITGLDRPWGFQEFDSPKFQDNQHIKVVMLSAICTGRFYSQKYSWYLFLLQAESTPGTECSRKDYVNEKFQWHHRRTESVTFRLVAQCLNQLRHQKRAPVHVLELWYISKIFLNFATTMQWSVI